MKVMGSVLLVGVLALGLAACGDDTSKTVSAGSPTTTSKPASSGPVALVKVTTTPLGKIVTTADGSTVYLFKPDTATASVCIGACAGSWPPVTVTGTPTADGIDAKLLGTVTRDDGTMQLTIAGHPVYRYAGDSQPGDTTGEGVGGKWFVLGPDGSIITGPPAADAATTTAVSRSTGY